MNLTATAPAFTSTSLANGKFCIRHGDVVIRKESSRSFPMAYVYADGWIRLAPDAQLKRLKGEPKIFPIVLV